MRHTLHNVNRDKLRHDARRDGVYNWKQLTANAIDRFTCPTAVKRGSEIAGQSVPKIGLCDSHDSISRALTVWPRLSVLSSLQSRNRVKVPRPDFTPAGDTEANDKHRKL